MNWVVFLLFAFAGPQGLRVPVGLDAYVPIPDDNPLTKENVQRGRELFFDKRLSRDSTISCATCHDPKLAFSDSRKLAVGVEGKTGNRRVPRILNRAYGKSFFWDGRVVTLEDQVAMPIVNPKEMDLSLEAAAARTGVDVVSLKKSLASYVRTILSGDSPYDRYVQGDREALTPEQRLGLQLFRGKAECASCHVGMNLTDEAFHNTGIASPDDTGRFAVTKQPEHRGAFKTPSLRDVARTPPYMHDGSLATLEEVIDYYDKGGISNPNLDPEIHKLQLTASEKKALVAFLHALNGRITDGL